MTEVAAVASRRRGLDAMVVVQVAYAAVVIAFFAQRIWTVYRDTGLFRRIGFDWGLFYSQASALAHGDVQAMYDVDRLGAYIQQLTPFTTTPGVPLLQWPAPYPPLQAALMLPLTFVPPPLAFSIWTLLSLMSAGHLVWRCSQVLSSVGRARLAFILITALPVIQTLTLGQPVLFLASATAECLLALRAGADFRGGAWLGVLAFKPQYALVLGAFLLWKRRWHAVAGAMLVTFVILSASLIAVGWPGLLAYERTLASMGDFRDVYANAAEMINWRSLIVNARPAIGNGSGIALFVVLSLATLATTAWLTRGPWRPGTPIFDLQLSAIMVVTLLVSYHSHMHGMVLLALPLAMVWRWSQTAPALRLATAAVIFVPTLALLLVDAVWRQSVIDYDAPLWVVWPVGVIALLVLLLTTLSRELRCWRSA